MIAAMLLLATVGEVGAQQRAGPPPQREELQRRLQARFGQIVAQQLGLEADEREALSRVLREAEAERRELFQRGQALRARLREQVSLAPADPPAPLPTEAQAREMLEEMRAVRRAEEQLRAAEEARLLEVLTPAQLVRFYAIREHLTHRIRRMQQGPGRGGGPGGPGPRGR